MRRPSRATPLLAAALGLAACSGLPDGTPAAPLPTAPAALRADRAQDHVGADVLAALRAGGEVRVVVSLTSAATETALAAIDAAGRSATLDAARSRSAMGTLRSAVRDAQGVALAALAEGIAGGKARVVHRYVTVPALTVVLRDVADLEALARLSVVRRIDLDVGGTGTDAASNGVIRVAQRHVRGNRGQGMRVAILDSGLDFANPDFAGATTTAAQACFGNAFGSRTNFCPNGTTRQFGAGAAQDDAGHGTHVGGIVGSRATSSGQSGVAPAVGIVPVKVLDNCSFAGCFYGFSEVVAALDWVVQNGPGLNVRAVNMSLGTGATFPGACDNAAAFTQAGAAAVAALRAAGIVVIASAGNNGSTANMSAPACLSQVVSVGAANNADVPAGFTNSNATTDLFAPGVSVVSSRIGGGTVSASGTSMAAPHVAGCAALLAQVGDEVGPAAIEARLRTSPFTVTRASLTFPRLDCAADVRLVAADARPARVSLTNSTALNLVVYSSPSFDATTIAVSNVRLLVNGFAPVAVARRGSLPITSVADVNGDGRADRLVAFAMSDLRTAGLVAGTAPTLIVTDRLNPAVGRWEAVPASDVTVLP